MHEEINNYQEDVPDGGFIKFIIDDNGEIYCDCKFDDSLCSIEDFADMFFQIFSGKLYAPTILFLGKHFAETGNEEMANALSRLLKEKFNQAAQESLDDQVVINPSELAIKISPSKQ